MDATNKEDIRRLEARLERENNYTTLDNHWSAIKNVHINQPLSDHHCENRNTYSCTSIGGYLMSLRF